MQRLRSAGDELAQLVDMTIEELVKQLKKSKNAKVRTAVMHTFAQLAHVLPGYTAEGFEKFLPEMMKLVGEDASYELILDTLMILRKLFKGSNEVNTKFQKNYENIYGIINKTLGHDYVKVVSESLRVAGNFVHVLRASNGVFDPRFGSIV